MNDSAQFWADPRLVYAVAATAVALLLITLWLFGRRKKSGRQAAVVCLMISIGLHLALLVLLPLLRENDGGSVSVDSTTQDQTGVDTIDLSSFDPEQTIQDAAGSDPQGQVAPLPVANLTDIHQQSATASEVADDSVEPEMPATDDQVAADPIAQAPSPASVPASQMPDSLVMATADSPTDWLEALDAELASTASQSVIEDVNPPPVPARESVAATMPSNVTASESDLDTPPQTPAVTTAPEAIVPGNLESDYANRAGRAKELALHQTGGNVQTEAAVAAALRYLVHAQRADGAWDPVSSGAGRENRTVLGVRRPGTGARAESAITGLALLTLMGAGHTHHQGEYADNVFRGLAYLIRNQDSKGSLAGQAAPYAANYSHGMAALAICEAAAITADPAAVESARRAVQFTLSQQHPTSGGWRYLKGDPGDLSQLGWQAMVLDAGHRAEIPASPRAVAGLQRFLQSVRKGSTGGLASYRPGQPPSRTMTAEALATRLLIGETVAQREIDEAERYLLQQPPGVGTDNYYYWYYATLALHQLQDDAWRQWNQALQERLLATQQTDGSWSSETMWGRYGGTVYTTSMAALCLEAYYRHAIRAQERVASRPTVK